LSSLGWCYENGKGVTKDEKEAFKCYSKAAEQGNGSAQSNLGWCYQKGKGVVIDEREAFKWYSKASEQGNADGQVNLAWCYENGKGVTKDEKEAFKWYSKASEQGNAYGQNGVGWCYEKGIGVTKDDKEAAKWYTKAAEQGNSDAGLQHILEKHSLEFADQGIKQNQIPDAIIAALTEGKMIRYQGRKKTRMIYEVNFNGKTHYIALTVSDNGYIVGANPRTYP
jgi:TPR repeat protein